MSQLGSIRIGPPPSMRRGWSIRAKVVALLIAPLAPLLVMAVVAVAIANSPARNLANARTVVDQGGVPVATVVNQIQIERALSVRYVSEKRPDDQATGQLAAARAATDTAIADFARSTSGRPFTDAATGATKSLLAKVQTSLADLPAGRKSVDDGESRFDVMTYYNGAIDDMFRLYRSIASLDDHVLAGQIATVVSLSEASEAWSREDSLVIGAITARTLSARDYSGIVGAIATQRQMYARAASEMPSADANAYKQLIATPSAKALRGMEDSILAHPDGVGAPLKIDPDAWQEDFNATFDSVQRFDSELTARAIDHTSSTASSQKLRLWLVILACAAMLAALIFFSWRIARDLLRRVAQLRGEALTLALERLPSVVARIQSGQRVDIASEAPPLAVGTDELGQLSEAFTRVQHVAISSAAHEATLREGFNQVFLNIARRSQTLLHRQLALLDAMERRATDPEELEELFRVDHLATRMRRHAEDLVILAGSTPGRGWRSPVVAADVLRAAASEVEEYARINVVVSPNVAVVGRAVNDVVHLLAELLENATLFSPPDSQVTLSAQVVPNGLAVEVEDRGLGMTIEAIDEANARLASPPDFDPQQSSRLGLFVVAKLAERQGIQVVLRRSPYGGITAVTLIPSELVVAPEELRSDTIEGAVIPGAIDGQRKTSGRAMALAGAPAAGRPDQIDEAATRTADGLPIRIRQASVARTLPEEPDDTREVPVASVSRTPEQMRGMLSSFQSGMARGRLAATTPTATTPTATTPTATTPIPTEPVVSRPAAAETAPAEPVPAEPVPVEPVPVEPVSAETTPAETADDSADELPPLPQRNRAQPPDAHTTGSTAPTWLSSGSTPRDVPSEPAPPTPPTPAFTLPEPPWSDPASPEPAPPDAARVWGTDPHATARADVDADGVAETATETQSTTADSLASIPRGGGNDDI